MSSAYAIALFGIFSTLAGVLAFAWAASRGQLRASESVKFRVLDMDGDAGGAASPSVPPSPRRARWLMAAIAFVFLCILSSTVLTVFVAARAAAPTGSQAGAAKCPF